jgi:O-antigen/teichoic acid export membrane protein
MIKRLLTIALLTGAGHITTLLSLKFIAKHVSNNTIASIGEMDSLSLLIVSVVAFGIQLSTTRELAILDDWKSEYYSTQSARFSLSLILMVLGFTGFFITKNYLFFIAPIIALNADYALYGRGKPIAGACVAFLRILIPSITLIVFSVYNSEYIVLYYSISIVVAYLFAGVMVSRVLSVKYFVVPRAKHLLKYIHNLRIGVASFALFFVGIGVINVLSYFNSIETIAVAYMALKLYLIFKGVRRIIIQSFFKELQDAKVSVKVDLFAIIAGIVFLATVVFYPKVLITLLFDEKYSIYTTTFTILGVAGFLSSFTTSSGTRLLLQKKDKAYSFNLILAAIITIASGVLFWLFIGDQPYLIASAVLLGEITISVLNVLALKEQHFFIKRIKIVFPILVLATIFIICKYSFSETMVSYVIALFLFGTTVFLYITKKINS